VTLNQVVSDHGPSQYKMMKRFYYKIPTSIAFKLGKLNHIALATRDAKSHLNFFGNVLGATIGAKLVSFTYILLRNLYL